MGKMTSTYNIRYKTVEKKDPSRRLRFVGYAACLALTALILLLVPVNKRPSYHVPVSSMKSIDVSEPIMPRPVFFRPFVDPLPTRTNRTLTWMDESETTEYSTAHCWGSNMGKNMEWKTTGCHVHQLCYNHSSQDFLYFRQRDQRDLMDPVSITVINYRWGTQYDPVLKFTPKIMDGPIPKRRWQTPASDQYVLHLGFVPHNPGHLLWDDYWSWLMLSSAVMSAKESTQKELHPLWVNSNIDPPWATCDWVRRHTGPGHRLQAGFEKRCEAINRRWLRLVLGEGHERPPETNIWPDLLTREIGTVMNPKDLICFANVAVGSGSMSRNMGGHDGWNPNDILPPTAGRSPLIYGLRNHLMTRAQVVDQNPPKRQKLIICYAELTSYRLPIAFKESLAATIEILPQLTEMVRQISGRSDVEVEAISRDLAKLSPKEQLEVMSETGIYVGAAGGGAMSAQFLPPGSGMILFYNRHDIHMGKDDWKIFGFTSWIRVEFLPVTSWNLKEASRVKEFLKVLTQQVAASAAFML